MKATARDVYQALTVRNVLIFGGIIALSIVLIDVLGYVIWRRFPIPTLIIFVAVLGWKIGRRIGHAGLSRILNAASVGLGCFGVAAAFAAVFDGRFFPVMGYVSWGTHITMWGWIAFHVWRAYRILKDMPPSRLMHVTEGTGMIFAEMTYRKARIAEVIERADEAAKMQFTAT
jgi:hypothetical protein